MIDMSGQESRIIEQRTIEATRKGYIGISGKFGVIVKYLGHPIIIHAENGGLKDTNYLPDFDQLEEDEWDGKAESWQNKLPYFDDEYTLNLEEPIGEGWREQRDDDRKLVSPIHTGMYFYGLSSGINMEIRYDTEERILSVKYEGNLVFKETAGELSAFVPGEWEVKAKILYEKAKTIEKKTSIKEKSNRTIIAKEEKKEWLQVMKQFWGL